MTTGRLETFTDGVLAIIITIMVLELRAPHEATFAALRPLLPVFLSYVLSFIYLGIYWNNHHHMLHVVHRVSGAMLWANLFLLFWLSLIPFVTAWMGENHFAQATVALYGVVLFMAAVSYTLLVRATLKVEGRDSLLAKAIGMDRKGNISLLLYVVGIAASFVSTRLAGVIYISVALIWLVPDRRIERVLGVHPAAKLGHAP
jgi:uncharacterized membrane protein